MQQEKTVNHLAGIVPIASPDNMFNMPWHDTLMPIADNYTAIERAVFECAVAGCDTIWIVGHLGTQPLIKKVVGEMIYDPATIYSRPEMVNTRHDIKRRKEIQIYYIPIHPKNRDRHDSLGHSILYGADTAYKVCSEISRWTTPKKFYCAFPFGVVPESVIYENRDIISSNTNIIFCHDGLSVKDNKHISFTFKTSEFKRCKDNLKEYALHVWHNSDRSMNTVRTLNMKLNEIFYPLDLSEYVIRDLPWFHEINSWDNYKNFLKSDENKLVYKRDNIFLTTKRYELFEGVNDT
jgi:hypothetical protein